MGTTFKQWLDNLTPEEQEAIMLAREGKTEDTKDDLAERGDYGGSSANVKL